MYPSCVIICRYIERSILQKHYNVTRLPCWLLHHRRYEFSHERVFRTCLLNNPEKESGWVPLESLYVTRDFIKEKNQDVESESAISQGTVKAINTPNQLLFVARRGLKCQVFDTKLWHDIYQRTVDLRDIFLPRQWVEIVHIFKRIKVRHNVLMDMATKELLYHLERLTLEDLSKLALSFAYHEYCQSAMFSRIATVVVTRLQRQSMESMPSEASGGRNETTSEGRQLSKITSYTHLLGAYARCNFPNQELFEAVGSDLLTQILSKEALIPPGFLVKIFASYSAFGYRHNKLFDALCKELVTAKVSTEDLLQLQRMMKSLDYENDLMLNVFAYRLGNATGVAMTSQRALISQ